MKNWLLVASFLSLISFSARAQQDSVAIREKKKHKFDFAGVPIISYNTSFGAVIGINSMMFFDVNPNDTISPPSAVGLGGGFSQNRSLFVAGFTKLYLSENRWRIEAAGGLGSINFQYFESPVGTGDGDFVDYSAVNSFALFKVLRRVKGPLYAGALLKFQHTDTSFDTDVRPEERVSANGFGITATYDSRGTQIYNPNHGVFSTLTLMNNSKWMGSDSSFYSLRFFLNYYFRLAPRSILAARVTWFGSLGDVPFSGQQSIGGKDIRGYTNGAYRGDVEYSAQAEYRWNFYKRWSAVTFFGIAFTERPYSGVLPGGGAGFRYRLLQKRNINIGAEVAWGKDDHGIYFRIGETF